MAAKTGILSLSLTETVCESLLRAHAARKFSEDRGVQHLTGAVPDLLRPGNHTVNPCG
jgi:hypothetical protein